VQAFGSQMMFGPGKARHDDHGLAIYEAAGFTGPESDQAATAVFTFVLGNALGPAAADALSKKLARDRGNPQELIRDGMRKARAIAGGSPRLRVRLATAAAAEYASSPDNTFEYGLNAILDGLEARRAAIGARSAPV